MINYVNLNKTYDNNYSNFQQIKVSAMENYEEEFNGDIKNDSFTLPDNTDIKISFDRGHRPPIRRDEVDERSDNTVNDKDSMPINNANNTEKKNDNDDKNGNNIVDNNREERPKFDEHKKPNKPNFPKRPPKEKLPTGQTIDNVTDKESTKIQEKQ